MMEPARALAPKKVVALAYLERYKTTVRETTVRETTVRETTVRETTVRETTGVRQLARDNRREMSNNQQLDTHMSA